MKKIRFAIVAMLVLCIFSRPLCAASQAARPALPAMKKRLAAVASATGQTNPLQYQQRILARTIDVLEGRVAALVYPPKALGK